LSGFVTHPVSIDCVIETPGEGRRIEELVFQPGETLKTVPISASGTTGSAVRVRLVNPRDAEITGLAAVLVVDEVRLGSSLGWIPTAGDVVLYWAAPNAALESSSGVSGPWASLAGISSPATIRLSQHQQFFRLVQQ
jgi:hypothetical protein